MPKYNFVFLLSVILLFLSACQTEAITTVEPTGTATQTPEPALTPTPTHTLNPTITPTPISPSWTDTLVIDSSSQLIISNDSPDYQLEEIFGSGIALDTDTRWTIDVQVDTLVQGVGTTDTAIVLIGYTESGIIQKLFLIYQNGNWQIGYIPDETNGNTSFWSILGNLRTPHQHFELSISADGSNISLINDAELEFHPSIKENLFEGAEVIMVNAMISPQTKISLSELIVSQTQNNDDLNLHNSFSTSENISDAKGLSTWVNEYVHAYGGQVSVNGIEMDSSQLTDTIRKNENDFIFDKNINGVDFRILMVNGSPLAVKERSAQWQEATMKFFGTLVDLKIGSVISNDRKLNTWWGNEYHIGFITHALREAMPENSTIDFGWPNYQTQIAKGNGMETMFEAVFFPADAPSWMNDGFTQEDLDNITRMIVENTKNQQTDYVVVANEVRIPVGWETPDIYWEKFGIDYIIRAFRIAREIYPEAPLIYDDTDNHLSGSFGKETTDLLSNALFKEGLIDYVGLQMHMEPDKIPNKDEMIEIFRSYPVPVVITSYDVLLTNIPENEHNEMLNKITKLVIDSCLESKVCKHFTTWGENDSVGWDGRSLLRDFDNNRKQAYYVAMQTMFEHLP